MTSHKSASKRKYDESLLTSIEMILVQFECWFKAEGELMRKHLEIQQISGSAFCWSSGECLNDLDFLSYTASCLEGVSLNVRSVCLQNAPGVVFVRWCLFAAVGRKLSDIWGLEVSILLFFLAFCDWCKQSSSS